MTKKMIYEKKNLCFDPFNGRIFALSPKGDSATVIRQGLGRLDGLELLPDGALVFTSWADSSIHLGRESSVASADED